MGQTRYTFEGFDSPEMGEIIRVAARLRVEIGGRTVPARPVFEVNTATGTRGGVPDYLPGGGTVQIATVDPNRGMVGLVVPGMAGGQGGEMLAVEVSTKPLIGLVWLGAILMLGSVFLDVLRRNGEATRTAAPEPSEA